MIKVISIHVGGEHLDSAFSSESMLAFAYLSAGCVLGIVFLLILRIISHRIQLVFYNRRVSRFNDRWDSAITSCIIDAESCALHMLPTLARAERFMFLIRWNYYQETLSGFAYDRLNVMARRLNILDYARHLLVKGTLRQRLVATVFLGNIHDKISWPMLEKQLHDDNLLLSIQAVRSLAQIDLDKALPLIFAEQLRRDDWQGVQVVAVLRKEIDADILTHHLLIFFQSCTDVEAESLLPFMAYMSHEARSRQLRVLINKSGSARLISRLLKAIDSDENLELARQYVDHDQWYVRNQAVAALGRQGGRADSPLLVKCLGDEQWWVRYRAAQGLARIFHDSVEELVAIRDCHEDRYARQMIDQVLAEGRFAHYESV